MKQIILPFLVIVAVAVALLFLGNQAKPQAESQSSGKAAIGGEFTLTDVEGNPFDTSTLKGKYRLVFFGFTHCPGVCPSGLANITAALDLLGDKAANITPVFITVDAERDTPEQMKQYLSNFHPSIIGLTGSAEEVKQAADDYKVYFSIHKEHEGDKDYAVDHSAFMYLMDKNGEYAAHFAHDTKPEELAEKLTQRIE